MRRLLFAVFWILLLNTVYSQATYTWNTASGSWTTSTNWTPTRTTPLSNDILVFNGSVIAAPTVTNVPTESIGGLSLINNVAPVLSATGPVTLSIGDLSVTGPHLTIAAGSTLNITGASVITLSIGSGFYGTVFGNIIFSTSAHQLLSADVNSLTFKNGSIFTANTGFSGNAFGATNLNSVVFEGGSTYIAKAGSNPFGAAAPASVVTFQSGSLYSHQVNALPSLSGRTYANFEINSSGYSLSSPGTLPFRCENFTLTNGTLVTLNLNGGVIISGNITVSIGTLNFSPLPAIPCTILFDGASNQSLNGSIIMNSFCDMAVAKGAIVYLNTLLFSPDSINVFGTLNCNNNLVLGNYFGLHPSLGATATTGDITLNSNNITNVANAGNWVPGIPISGAGIPAGTYVLSRTGTTLRISKFATSTSTGVTITPGTSTGTIGIGSADGIYQAPTSQGNVQSTFRDFPADGNYTYNGNIAQSTGDGLPLNLTGTLKINNTAGIATSGVTLYQSTNVSGTLDLTAGKLTTTASQLLTILNGGTSINGSSSSFVSGPLKKTGNVGFLFPLGKGSIYAPLTIANGTGEQATDEFVAEYLRTNPQSVHGTNYTSPINHISYVEYWNLTRAVGASTKVVSLYLNQYSFCLAPNNTFISRWNSSGSIWTVESSSGSYSTCGLFQCGTMTSGEQTSFGDFTFGTDLPFGANPLPVKLLSFDAQKINSSAARLFWQLTDLPSREVKFEVERSTDKTSFRSIVRLGANETMSNYQLNDDHLPQGVSYYRLKMTDINGTITYSKIVAVLNSDKGIFITSLYPNPAKDQLMIEVSSAGNTMVSFDLVDINGKQVRSFQRAISKGSNMLGLDIQALPGGIYQIIATAGSYRSSCRFVKN